MSQRVNFNPNDPNAAKAIKRLIIVAVIAVIIVPIGLRSFQTVEPGHVAVATLFGQVKQDTYEPGLHFVNPLLKFHHYDARARTHKESAGVPSQDQLTTQVDVSVQWTVDRDMAAVMLSDTGSAEQALNVHLVPKLRSLLREEGKTIQRAEDFFLETTQEQLQTALLGRLKEFLAPKGIVVEDVLIRDITLPQRLVQQIEQKKEVEQQSEREKAELERFRTQEEQKTVAAEAERRAAEEEAEKLKVLADARAYEIEQINKAIANAPGYIQLEALKALQAMAKDPAAKLYFINGDSPMPLPLMHMGEGQLNP